MNINQYDKILLKDGRTASVVEIFGDGEVYLVDVDLPGPDWETIAVKECDIKKVM
jgi:hypothetical protein